MINKASILIVDDEKDLIEVLSSTLTKRGYETVITPDPVKALDYLKERKFDLLITDINMPGLDGVELIRYAIQINPRQRVVVVTGFPTPELQTQIFRMGALRCIIKPFRVNRFMEVINDVMGKGEPHEAFVGPVELGSDDLIQLYAMGKKSVILEIREGMETGRIYFVKGDVVHAETTRGQGEKAFMDILGWKSGTFVTEPIAPTLAPPRTITTDVTTLLLESARLRDEGQTT